MGGVEPRRRSRARRASSPCTPAPRCAPGATARSCQIALSRAARLRHPCQREARGRPAVRAGRELQQRDLRERPANRRVRVDAGRRPARRSGSAPSSSASVWSSVSGASYSRPETTPTHDAPTESSPHLKIEFAQASDPGRDPNKQVNEDSCGYAETHFGHLCVLCDGMGGHYGGKEASRTAITTIFEMIDRTPAAVTPAAARSRQRSRRRAAASTCSAARRRTAPRPGSTVVAMLFHDRGRRRRARRRQPRATSSVEPDLPPHARPLDGAGDDRRRHAHRGSRRWATPTRTRSRAPRDEAGGGGRGSPRADGALPGRRADPVERRPDRSRAPPATSSGATRQALASGVGRSRVQDARAAREPPRRSRQHHRADGPGARDGQPLADHRARATRGGWPRRRRGSARASRPQEPSR